jgi:hypothetical protein
MTSRRIMAGTIALTAALVVGVDRVSACLFMTVIIPVHSTRPADAGAFAKGSIGVVPPTYARRYLVGAYRRFSGLPTTGLEVGPKLPSDVDSAAEWLAARDRILHRGELTPASLKLNQWAVGLNYQAFLNCSDNAFVVATRTLEARVRVYGENSATVADWLRAQDAVFANCQGGRATLPEPAAAPADALTRADRAYQTASALFYACDYENAAAKFRAIADDGSSPWRVYGRLLAGRALMRRASLKLDAEAARDVPAIAARADAEFAAAETDRTIPDDLRASAASLRHILFARSDPVARLHQLSAQAMRNGPWSFQEVTDFTVLFDDAVSRGSSYDYDRLAVRDAVTRSDDLLDWIVTLQGTGRTAAAHALARWKSTRSTPWLVAALWKTPADSADAPALLTAAANVPRGSPASTTIAFLRVRLLLGRGAGAEAARTLAQLPDSPTSGTSMETVNLFRALRLQSANSLDAWLAAAPRWSVWEGMALGDAAVAPHPEQMGFDQDSARLLTEQFPLTRMLDAAETSTLPARLRLILASAAWTRATELNDDGVGQRVAPLLERLAPKLGPEIDQYLAAGDPEQRHDRALLMILRWPTFRNYVPLAEWAPDGVFVRFTTPLHMSAFEMRSVWWCGFDEPSYLGAPGPYEEAPVARLGDFVPPAHPPSFLTSADRAQGQSEWARIAALGAAPNYLTREALAWAKARPDDADVPEALALAVQGTHTSCSDKQTGALSHAAFDLLHQRYPASPWTKKTKYWYEGW